MHRMVYEVIVAQHVIGVIVAGWLEEELADERGDVEEGDVGFQKGAGASSR